MGGITDPPGYEAWYHTRRGARIAAAEFALMTGLLRPQPGASLLDAGSGTGHFSRRFAGAGLRVVGVDPDTECIRYARSLENTVEYVAGTALALPFGDETFDYGAAVTSLCFVGNPMRALSEIWRVSRRGVLLGLLNRRSLLFRRSYERGGYKGGRWDDIRAVNAWIDGLSTPPVRTVFRTCVLLPGGGLVSRLIERGVGGWLPWGGFLAVYLEKSS